MHVEDLLDLIDEQFGDPERWAGATVNVGGGAECSLSLRETTELCRQITGESLDIRPSLENRPGNAPIYISDCTRLYAMADWRPRRSPAEILGDIHAWIVEHEAALATAL
jgi:CDP-paratose 2-epimerase